MLDHDHAAHGRRELEAIMQPADEGRLLTEAERVLQANWRLLDGVQARASLESPARDQQQPPERELDALSLAGAKQQPCGSEAGCF